MFLLGGLRVEYNGQVVHTLLRKDLALLAYFACNPQEQQRETIATLLWDSLGHSQALGNLRTTLKRVRKLGNILEADHLSIRWVDYRRVWVDAIACESQLWRLAGRGSTSGLLVAEDVQTLTNALALYRGKFLEGVIVRKSEPFEEWARSERERLHLLALRALNLLVTHYTASDDSQNAMYWAKQLVQLDPLNEAAVRDLMRAQVACLQLTAALSEYQQLKRRLRSELDVEPAFESNVLYQEIRRQQRTRLVASYRTNHKSTPKSQVRSSNLPRPILPIIGRQVELIRLQQCLTDPRCRILTILGSSGVGKTRLAIEAGQQILNHPLSGKLFTDGIYWVRLEEVDSPQFLINAIAVAVGCTMQGVINPLPHLFAYLRTKSLLLVCDNFEHLLSISAYSEIIVEIIQNAAQVKVLITSLERLGLEEEWLMHVWGLPHPASAAQPDWNYYPAVELFMQQAEQVHAQVELTRDGEAIVRICEQLQGLPLGIQLAAAVTRVFPCARIAAELEQNFDFLSSTMRTLPVRQRSLRAVFHYVWSLLNEQERQMLAPLAIFEGSFGEDALRQVAQIQLPTLLQWLERSLVQPAPSSTPDPNTIVRFFVDIRIASKTSLAMPSRYQIHRIFRGYLLEKLTSYAPLYEKMCKEHSVYYLAMLSMLAAQFDSVEGSAALAALSGDLVNIRSAWRYALQVGLWREVQAALSSLTRFYLRHGPLQEGVRELKETLDLIGAQGPHEQSTRQDVQQLVALLLIHLAEFYNELGQYDAVFETLRSPVITETNAGVAGMAMMYLQMGRAYYHTGCYQDTRGELAKACALAADNGLWRIELQALCYIGAAYGFEGNYAVSRTHLESALEGSRRHDDITCELMALQSLARDAYFSGDYSQVQSNYDLMLTLLRRIGNRVRLGLLLNNIGALAHQLGQHARASETYLESLSIVRQVGDRRGEEQVLANLCLLSLQTDQLSESLDYGKQCLESVLTSHNRDIEAYVRTCLGHLFYRLQDYAQAHSFYEAGLALRRQLNQPGQSLEPLAGLARLALEQGETQQATTLAAQIWIQLQARRPAGVVEVIKIYLVCYDIFASYRDSRAEQVLGAAQRMLQEDAAKISDPEQRRSYLETVATHRRLGELLRAAQGD
jgi:predicted ATPase/DNA-binding SARP family transcriptional activator